MLTVVIDSALLTIVNSLALNTDSNSSELHTKTSGNNLARCPIGNSSAMQRYIDFSAPGLLYLTVRSSMLPPSTAPCSVADNFSTWGSGVGGQGMEGLTSRLLDTWPSDSSIYREGIKEGKELIVRQDDNDKQRDRVSGSGSDY